MFTRLFLAYFFFMVSLGFPPLLLVSVPLLFVSTRAVMRRVREGRKQNQALDQVKAEQAYVNMLRHQAKGGF